MSITFIRINVIKTYVSAIHETESGLHFPKGEFALVKPDLGFVYLINKCGIEPGAKVTDMAGGNGRHARYVNKLIERKGEITLMDLSLTGSQKDSLGKENIYAYRGDMSSVDRQSGSQTHVILWRALCRIPDESARKYVMEEVERISNYGSRLLFAGRSNEDDFAEAGDEIEERTRIIQNQSQMPKNGRNIQLFDTEATPRPYHFFTPEEIYTLFDTHRFRIREFIKSTAVSGTFHPGKMNLYWAVLAERIKKPKIWKRPPNYLTINP